MRRNKYFELVCPTRHTHATRRTALGDRCRHDEDCGVCETNAAGFDANDLDKANALSIRGTGSEDTDLLDAVNVIKCEDNPGLSRTAYNGKKNDTTIATGTLAKLQPSSGHQLNSHHKSETTVKYRQLLNGSGHAGPAATRQSAGYTGSRSPQRWAALGSEC
ncbi:hypothetical protein BaRGS_00008076 [Batillaria attramentaria]|uniref:Uncharacterized protein n=1 Tax=Batillaria attramentaria TaxID=370345 RepID=A0ABD0LP45_9CAEN